MRLRWNITVNTRDGEKTGLFYYSDKNLVIKYPERFNLPIDDSEEYGDVTKDMVGNLKEDEKYWVVDSYDDLSEYFPKVPDVPPSEGKPTYFVAIPRSQIVDVYPNVTLRTDSELETLKKKYYRGEITYEELDNQLN